MKLRAPILALISAVIWLFALAPAGAQQPSGNNPAAAGDTPAQALPGLENIPPELVPELLEEMELVHNQCQSFNLMTTFYDCQCLAVKYLDARIKLGPDASRESVMASIDDQCANEVEVAGYSYGVCEQRMTARGRKDVKEYCECFARTVTNWYKRAPDLNSRYLQILQREAYLRCSQPRPAAVNPAQAARP